MCGLSIFDLGSSSKCLFLPYQILLSRASMDKEVACLVVVFSLIDRRSLDNAKRILQNVTQSGLNN